MDKLDELYNGLLGTADSFCSLSYYLNSNESGY